MARFKEVKRLRHSASKITMYKGCPLAYFLKYEQHVQVINGINLSFGKIIHSMLDSMYEKNYKDAESFTKTFGYRWHRCCSGEDLRGKSRENLVVTDYPSIDREGNPVIGKDGKPIILKLGNHIKIYVGDNTRIADMFGNPINENGRKITPADVFWGYKAMGKRMLRNFYEAYIKKPVPAIREERFTLDIEGHPDSHGIKKKHNAIVIFDRVDVFKDESGRWRCTIGDYKTDKGDPEKKAFSIHRHPQFSLYSLAFRQLIKEGRLKGKIPDEITQEDAILYYHMRDEKIVPTYRSERDFDYVRSLLDDVSFGILNRRFTPFYGFHCGMCDYRAPCEEYSHSHGGPRIDLEGKIQPAHAFDWDEDYNRFLREGPAKYDFAVQLSGQGELPFGPEPIVVSSSYAPKYIELKPKKVKRIEQRKFKFKVDKS